ncbi:AAA family ATPase [Bacillus sp. PK3-056]|uniref:ATP-dependent nuclease n=1 Tax=Niallia circulans TaxID=1397 RepID=UPI000F45E279|nr:AAA family ATPase [Niallia circulans]AYV72439.1 ATP-dependent endonuclease [Niallia circulans]
MIIQSLRIKNFRSFGDTETTIDLSNISTFVGGNSSGKTAALQAIQKLFGLTASERTLVKGDFHTLDISQVDSTSERDLYIEVRIDFPELKNTEKLEGKLSIPPFFNHFTINSPNECPYVRMRLVGKWSAGTTPEGEIEQKLYFITVPYGEDVNETTISPVSPHQRSAIQMIYVPAIREPLTQLKNASGTILWRILNSINWPEDMDQQIELEMKPVDALFEKTEGVGEIKNVIGEHWKKYHFEDRYQDANIKFNSTTLESILKKIEVQFSPTQESSTYTIDKLGDGLRSLFYLSLVSSLLEVEQQITKKPTAALTILAVEEPENHISPHLLGKVVENLKEISEKNNAQVLLSSHSESIIKNVSPEDICHLRIDKKLGQTIAKKIALPSKESEAYMYIKEAVRAFPEIYFAKLVILGEGDTEEIIIPKLLKVKEISSFESSISIVPLGGRHVNHMWRLLNQLDIPHITLLDLDLERGGGGWGRIKYVLQELINNGYDRNKLLAVMRENGPTIITEKEFEVMHEWGIDKDSLDAMKTWLDMLEGLEYNVFFSGPLDMDFLMLEKFPLAYKEIMKIGPRLPDRSDKPDEYRKKINSSIQATLKNINAIGKTYSEEQHELMVWYNSLFLGRGKPSTHIEALTKISENSLLNDCPQVLVRLLERIKLKILM